MCVCAGVCACVCVLVRACVRMCTCVHECVRVLVCVLVRVLVVTLVHTLAPAQIGRRFDSTPVCVCVCVIAFVCVCVRRVCVYVAVPDHACACLCSARTFVPVRNPLRHITLLHEPSVRNVGEWGRRVRHRHRVVLRRPRPPVAGLWNISPKSSSPHLNTSSRVMVPIARLCRLCVCRLVPYSSLRFCVSAPSPPCLPSLFHSLFVDHLSICNQYRFPDSLLTSHVDLSTFLLA